MQQRINKIREAILFGKNYIVFGTGFVAVAAAMEISDCNLTQAQSFHFLMKFLMTLDLIWHCECNFHHSRKVSISMSV